MRKIANLISHPLFNAAVLALCVFSLPANRVPAAEPELPATPDGTETEIDARVLAAQNDRIAVMQRAAAATISIFGLDGGGGGSGVIISPDGYALTNYHVSSACGDHMRCGLNDGKMYDAVIVGVDATGDVSLIKLLGRDDFPTAPLADSDQVRVGQWCFAAGNPFVLATNLQPSISMGIVSGVNRYQYPAGTLLEYADCIQTDAAINPGNSGGPLFNLAGEVIGINGRCSFEKRARVNVGVGYAISANQVKNFMGVLRSGRLVDHATLGATVSTDDSGKILVSNILSSSDAYRRGLRYGDEVVALAGREIRTTNTFKNILGTLPKDWRVPLEIRREGKLQTLLVRLAGVHTEKQLVELVSAELGEAKPGQPSPPEAPDPTERDSDDKPDDKPGDKPGGSPEEQEAMNANENISADGVKPNKALVASLLEPRFGFSNYHFSKLNRDRLWSALKNRSDLSETAPVWQLTGSLAGEPTEVTISLTPEAASLQIGTRLLTVPMENRFSEVVDDRRETGLLVALLAHQELMRFGPARIGDTTYLGTYPVYAGADRRLSEQPVLDTLQTLWYDTTVRFAIDDQACETRLVEVFGPTDSDPVELYLDQYREFESGGQSYWFPARLRLQYGTEPVFLIELKSIDVARPEEPAEPDVPPEPVSASGDDSGDDRPVDDRAIDDRAVDAGKEKGAR